MPVIVFFPFRGFNVILPEYRMHRSYIFGCKGCQSSMCLQWTQYNQMIFMEKIKCFLKYDLHSCTHTFRASTQHSLLNSSHRNREWMFAFSATILLLSTIHMQNCSLHCNDSSCVFASIARADIRGTVWYSLRRVECWNLFHGGKTAI